MITTSIVWNDGSTLSIQYAVHCTSKRCPGLQQLIFSNPLHSASPTYLHLRQMRIVPHLQSS